MTAVKAMLFDLDGTLLDSAPDFVDALNRLRAENGLAAVQVDDVAYSVSRGAPGLLKAGMPEAEKETVERWRRELIADYAASGFPRSRLYDGVAELLETLENKGVPWGIVTNRSEYLTRAFVKHQGMEGRISSVVCGDTLTVTKPHPDPVLLACEQLGVSPADTVFAGDDPRDIQAGQAAGAMTAAVFYGYGSGQLTPPLVDESYPVHHPSDLLALL